MSVVQILSALAVVGSLVYAVSEFKRSETLNSRDVENTLYQRMLEMDRLLIETPDLAEIVAQATNDPDGLSPEGRVRFLAYEHIFYDSWESAWYYHRDGVLEESAWRSWNTWFLGESKRRPLLGWTGNRQNTDSSFLEYVDAHLMAGAADSGAPVD